GGAHEEDRLASCLEGERRRDGEIGENSDAPDGRGWQDRPAVGLVVERHIARYHWEIERPAGLRNPAHAADELAHDLRPFRLAEVEVVRNTERPAPHL